MICKPRSSVHKRSSSNTFWNLYNYIWKFVQIHFSGRHSPSKCLSSPSSPWFIYCIWRDAAVVLELCQETFCGSLRISCVFFPLIFLSFLSPSAPLLSPFTSCKLSPSFKQTTNLKNKRKFEGESASGCSAHQRQEIQLRGIFSQLNSGRCKAKHILTTSEKFHN